MLIAGRTFWKLHGRWLMGTALASLAALAWTAASGWRAGRWPGGGSLSGLVLGTLAAIIFAFEMALVAKKSRPFRTARWALSAQAWMKAHIWLGLFTVPLVLLHCGGRMGGPLTSTLMFVFAAVIASGVWGLVLQNVLPRLLLESCPVETVTSQIDVVGRQYAEEARRLVRSACGDSEVPSGRAAANHDADSLPAPLAVSSSAAQAGIQGMPRPVGWQRRRAAAAPTVPATRPIASPAVRTALQDDILPFLELGSTPRGQLGPRQRNEWYFEDLRLRVEPPLRGLVDRLQELCEQRRQLNVQRRLNFWLHNWLALHQPLSAALLILLVVHIAFALRFG